MKNIKSYKLFETSKDENMKRTQAKQSVMKIADDTEAEDGPKWTKDFVANLKKAGYEVFKGDLKNFKPQDFDVIIGPEDYPGDSVDLFFDGIVETHYKPDSAENEYDWNEYYLEYGPDVFGEDSIIVARKK